MPFSSVCIVNFEHAIVGSEPLVRPWWTSRIWIIGLKNAKKTCSANSYPIAKCLNDHLNMVKLNGWWVSVWL